MDEKKCPNCKEEKQPCACMRNKCVKCGNPVGNITFSWCDTCFDNDILKRKLIEKDKEIERLKKEIESWKSIEKADDGLKENFIDQLNQYKQAMKEVVEWLTPFLKTNTKIYSGKAHYEFCNFVSKLEKLIEGE